MKWNINTVVLKPSELRQERRNQTNLSCSRWTPDRTKPQEPDDPINVSALVDVAEDEAFPHRFLSGSTVASLIDIDAPEEEPHSQHRPIRTELQPQHSIDTGYLRPCLA
ncbi:unnamed protein product [Urochloa humidicola]